ncbi:hypothetical protein CRUP_014224 [Coryphaenoides rupestris]|nr:hypothetical protein CRUP_014224 [Coryphaenoides rupestris]
MASYYKHEGAEEPSDSDCPVCYESLGSPGVTGRTLSCGHGFCHDCLVRTLLVGVPRAADGVLLLLPDSSIVCPVCRHLTFIRRRREEEVVEKVVVVVSNTEKEEQEKQEQKKQEEEEEGAQTLQVPIRAPSGSFTHDARLPTWRRWVDTWRRWVRRGLVIPSLDHGASQQIFIISTQGRPMAEEDRVLSSSPGVLEEPGQGAQPQGARRRRRVKICTTGRCLVFLLVVFTLLALVAATLPWILLA